MNITYCHPLSRLRRLHNHLPTLALLGSMAIVFAIKYIAVSHYLDMGCDIANYLSTMHTFFGQDPNGLGLLRPPLIALPLKAFTLVFGDLTGVKLLGVTLSVSIGIPFYLLARRVSVPWVATAMTVVFVLTPAYSDMLSWGYITMTGMLFLLLAFHFFLRVIEKPSGFNVVFTGISLSFIVGFHQLSLAFSAPLFLLLGIALLVFNRQKLRENYRPVTMAIIIGILLSIPYIPLYLRLLEMQPSAASDVPFSFTPYYAVWIVSMILSLPLLVIVLKRMLQQDRSTAIAITALFLYSSVLLLLLLPPPFVELNRRAHYFLYPAIWLMVSAFLSHLWSQQVTRVPAARHWLLKACTLILIVALVSSTLVLSQEKLHHRLRSFGYLDTPRWNAVSWIRDHTSSEGSVVAYPEALGWWIEAEAGKETLSVTDRNTAPLEILRERSLIAELILSRNQGLENGNLRLATSYPYNGTPGNPALAVCAGGFYHDLIMFDDSHTRLGSGDSSDTTLASVQPEVIFAGDNDNRTVRTSRRIDSAEVVQTVNLQRGSQAAIVSYDIGSDTDSLNSFEVPLFFGFKPRSVLIDPGQHHIEVVQDLQTPSGQLSVTTEVNIATDNAVISQIAQNPEGHLDMSFNLQGLGATITFTLVVMDPDLHSNADVEHYQVPEIIRENSVRYLVVDFGPNPHLASGLPSGIEEWLSSCPYYELVYPEGGDGDVRVYQVLDSALPIAQ